MSGPRASTVLPGLPAGDAIPDLDLKGVSDAIQAAMLGGVDPQAAAETASTQLDQFLASYTGAPML